MKHGKTIYGGGTFPSPLKSLVLLTILFAGGAHILPAPLSAQDMRIHQPPRNIQAAFLLNNETIAEESLSVRSRGEAVSYFITFSGGQAGNTGGRYLTDGTNTLYYGIYDGASSRSQLKDIDDNPNTDEVLSGSLENAGNGWAETLETFAIILEYDQFPPAGQYTDDFTMTLYRGNVEDISSAEKIDETQASIMVTVESALDIALVPSGSPFDETDTSLTLDFGVLSAGSERSGDIMVRSNDTYSLSLNSTHGGVMENFDENDPSTVPYTLFVDGTPLSLSAGTETTVAAYDGPTSVTGKRYGLKIRIEDFGMATEGKYEDTLSVTVTAQ